MTHICSLQRNKHTSPRGSARPAKLLTPQYLRVLCCQTDKKQFVMRQPPHPHAVFVHETNLQAYQC